MEAFLAEAGLTTLAAQLAGTTLDELTTQAVRDRDQLLARLKALGIAQLGKRHSLTCALLRRGNGGASAAHETSAAAPTPLRTKPPSVLIGAQPAPAAGASADGTPGPRCALLLFGLPKFFRGRVLPLMTRKLIEQLPLPCDVFAHTYDLTTTTNPRNRERDCALDPSEVEAAAPLAFELQSQDAVDAAQQAALERLKRFGDAWHNDFGSLRNVLREANSLARAYALMEAAEEQAGTRYGLVCCSRMDVLYVDKLPTDCAAELRRALDGADDPAVCFVPNFHEWRLSLNGISRTGGMNDRFAIGTRAAMRAYAAERLDSFERFCEAKQLPLHTETFLQWHMRQKRADVRRMHFRLQRIRANGEVHDGDRELLPHGSMADG